MVNIIFELIWYFFIYSFIGWGVCGNRICRGKA
jgi:uncharacterized membrane protein